MSVTILLDLKAAPGAIDKLKQIFVEILPDTRAYDGCEGLDVHLNQDDGDNLVIVERWQSRPHYEKYFAWRGTAARRAAKCSFSRRDRDLIARVHR
jgi:quinol monooxygenase YgiN